MVIWKLILILSGYRPLGHVKEPLTCSLRVAFYSALKHLHLGVSRYDHWGMDHNRYGIQLPTKELMWVCLECWFGVLMVARTFTIWSWKNLKIESMVPMNNMRPYELSVNHSLSRELTWRIEFHVMTISVEYFL